MVSSTNLGRDLQRLLERIVEDVTDQAHDVALDVELVGISSMRDRVTSAVTDWGSKRQAGLVPGPGGRTGARPHAGRRETDQMYNAITGKTDHVPGSAHIEIVWGWEDPEDYYRFQEHGTDKIAPMESLHISLHEAEDALIAGLRRIK